MENEKPESTQETAQNNAMPTSKLQGGSDVTSNQNSAPPTDSDVTSAVQAQQRENKLVEDLTDKLLNSWMTDAKGESEKGSNSKSVDKPLPQFVVSHYDDATNSNDVIQEAAAAGSSHGNDNNSTENSFGADAGCHNDEDATKSYDFLANDVTDDDVSNASGDVTKSLDNGDLTAAATPNPADNDTHSKEVRVPTKKNVEGAAAAGTHSDSETDSVDYDYYLADQDMMFGDETETAALIPKSEQSAKTEQEQAPSTNTSTQRSDKSSASKHELQKGTVGNLALESSEKSERNGTETEKDLPKQLKTDSEITESNDTTSKTNTAEESPEQNPTSTSLESSQFDAVDDLIQEQSLNEAELNVLNEIIKNKNSNTIVDDPEANKSQNQEENKTKFEQDMTNIDELLARAQNTLKRVKEKEVNIRTIQNANAQRANDVITESNTNVEESKAKVEELKNYKLPKLKQSADYDLYSLRLNTSSRSVTNYNQLLKMQMDIARMQSHMSMLQSGMRNLNNTVDEMIKLTEQDIEGVEAE